MRAGSRTVATALAPAVTMARSLGGHAGLTILGWHRVDGLRSQGLSTGVDDFRRHLDVLDDWGARVLDLDVAVAALREGTLPERAVALTFDDGYASVVETAWPILSARSLPATMFIVSGFLAGELRFAWDHAEVGADRLRLVRSSELADVVDSGLAIGSHTVSHRWLPHLAAQELEHELCASREVLEGLVSRQVRSLAYPSGGWTPAVRAAAGRAGYDIAITVDRGVNHSRTHALSLRRAFVPSAAADLRLLLAGAYTFLRPLDSWRNRKGPAW